jgi:hypothetical protein
MTVLSRETVSGGGYVSLYSGVCASFSLDHKVRCHGSLNLFFAFKTEETKQCHLTESLVSRDGFVLVKAHALHVHG